MSGDVARVRDSERTQDPPVRRDGRCATAGCTRPLPRSKPAMRYAGAQLETDPFCSTGCCRRFHGCELPATSSVWDDPGRAEELRGRQYDSGIRNSILPRKKEAA